MHPKMTGILILLALAAIPLCALADDTDCALNVSISGQFDPLAAPVGKSIETGLQIGTLHSGGAICVSVRQSESGAPSDISLTTNMQSRIEIGAAGVSVETTVKE